MGIICPCCENDNFTKLRYEIPLFRHLDFTTISKSAIFYQCKGCEIILNNPNVVKTETQTMLTKQYAYSHQTKQTMYIDEHSNPVTRSFLQAKILAEQFINNKQIRILDIGCFDGSLLVELDKMLSNAELWGFDFNPYLKSLFPEKENFHFILKEFEKLEGPFDLIILSHSIIYMPNLRVLMGSINDLIKNDGKVFIQIPNINKNPYYSLMGDQNIIFTATSLKNILSKYGYKGKTLNTNYFPRELLILTDKSKSKKSDDYRIDNLFESNINNLLHVKSQLEKIDNCDLAVLGTTINSSFIDEIRGCKILFFVDENPSNIGKVFRSKKVLHPEELNTGHHTIIPFGESGIDIQNKYRELYKGSFTLISI